MLFFLDAAYYISSGIAASVLFLALSEIGMRVRNERTAWFHKFAVLIAGAYLSVVFSVTLSPGSAVSPPHFGSRFNLVPFKALAAAFTQPWNLWGNIILFVPFGILLVMLFNICQKLPRALLAGAGISLLIELLQLFGPRSTDIDDVLLNTLGTLFGYLAGKLILFFAPPLRKKIGVYKKTDGKYLRKRRDAGGITVLAFFVLVSVFITGFTRARKEFRAPGIISEVKSVAAPPSEAAKPKIRYVQISAKAAYLWDVGSDTALYEKDSRLRIAPASTAKMLTALTALKYCGVDEKVTVGEEVNMIAENASRAWLRPGNELTVRQLLDALLLPSGNDAAYALAVYGGRKIRGDGISASKAIAAFVKAMNEKAVDIGAEDSNFVSTDGYDADGQYTTARDLALIAGEFLKSDVLRDIAGKYKISDVWPGGHEVTYYNTNELINPDSPFYYKAASGLKTGSSKAAGSCLVSCAYIDKELYICVVMGSTDDGRWSDSLALYRAVSR
ncbi:MAG: VanZ family protein [Bacillota bacterium]|nr:VanZ family protein [Bacillota bacterium]